LLSLLLLLCRLCCCLLAVDDVATAITHNESQQSVAVAFAYPARLLAATPQLLTLCTFVAAVANVNKPDPLPLEARPPTRVANPFSTPNIVDIKSRSSCRQ